MDLDKTDSLALILELFKRASEANKLKTLEITLSNKTVDDLTSAMSNIMDSYFSSDDKTTKHEWSTNAKLLPAHKKIYGVNMSRVVSILNIKKAMIIEGVPGTGKSVLMFNLINELSENNAKYIKVVSFSETTSYSEFIEGIRNVNGKWQYADGTFLSFCKLADSDREHNYYFGIDEISRGNTESIFGEVMTAVESRDTIITLQSGNSIVVPSNLYIIGTMNTLDKSSKHIDRATADRFTHFRLEPQWNTEYINSISNNISLSDTERCRFTDRLKRLCETMVIVNEQLTKESIHGYDNVIGTRAISLITDNEGLSEAIKCSIIPDIKSKQNMCSLETSRSLDALISSLGKI